jgi:flagellar protein FliO/FliZ
MTQSYLSVLLFLAALACLPWAIKWLQKKKALFQVHPEGQSKLISAVAVGPTQKVVTIEVGPETDRQWLTVGVTAQQITLLHSHAAPRLAAGSPSSQPTV